MTSEYVLNVHQWGKPSVILCTGPSFGRKSLLELTTEWDLLLLPYKKIFLSTNDPRNLDVVFRKERIEPVCHLFQQRDKQLDCLNCILSSIKNAVNHPESNDDDIILFKHESLFLQDMNLVNRALKKITDGCDAVARYWVGFPQTKVEGRLNDYYHSSSFYITVKAARPLFQDHPEITSFTDDYQFCEEYLTKHIFSKLPNIYSIPYRHSSWKDGELGLYHLPRYEDPASWLWDKKNYNELYQ